MSGGAVFRLLCTAKFRNLAAARPRGSQIFELSLQRGIARAVAGSPEFDAGLDTQHFVQAGRWTAVLHHQAHKSPGRAGVELFPTVSLFGGGPQGALLAQRLALPREAELRFPSSLAWDEARDCLAVGINGDGFRGAVFLYTGITAGRPHLAARIDLHACGHERPAGMAFLDGALWVTSYSGDRVSVFEDPLDGAARRRTLDCPGAPIGLCAAGGVMHATLHLDHAVASWPPGGLHVERPSLFDHPWGIARCGEGLLAANLNLAGQGRSFIAWAPDARQPQWQRLVHEGGEDLFGFSAVQGDPAAS